ncbi:ankyrin repeat domain-containing protein 27-like isoform X2 [Venturia canescens]|uniref:ankyrin repeat domain-containing protein 27-like isoform X2 n=1 Tax=Venturia canescens TaxID=32260 RepID=UPI001C9C4D46|nr:ankyrin repeat domain-containing protein 27-like isoform X2 [Venturia canescens]XP_043266862.1 ankyrin repeat domain-containing protein 27-like isoform X2 [Venturia canescens]
MLDNLCAVQRFLERLNNNGKFYDHILQPVYNKPCYFVSTDTNHSRTYKIEGTFIKLVLYHKDGSESDGYKVKIINIERGYNKEFHSYNIVIVEKPMDLKYCATRSLPSAKMKLNRTIDCYKEAVNFLHELSSQEHCSLGDLRAELQSMDMDRYNSADELRGSIQDMVRRHWARTMRRHTLDVQRDVRFQKLLSVSLEIFIMHHLHDPIYSLLSNALDQDDLCIKKKIDQLIDIGVTADQLGAKESLAISLPSAIVELATLDAREGPQEKLSCLKTTLDLTIAEIKGALAAVETRMDFPHDNDMIGARKSILVVPTDDLIPLLIYVIVKSRPRRLITDLHYIQNFLWSVSPHDGLSYTIVTFKAAICALQEINVKRLPARSCKVKNELPISEALDVLNNSDNETTPLDQQVRQLADMLGECTRSYDTT